MAFAHEGEHGLRLEHAAFEAKLLKDELGHFLSVPWGIQGSLGDENLRGAVVFDAHLLLEGVPPQLLEVVPVVDFSVGDGVPDIQKGAIRRRLITEHDFFEFDIADVLVGTEHRSAHDGGDVPAGEAVASKAHLEVTCTIIAHDFVVLDCVLHFYKLYL